MSVDFRAPLSMEQIRRLAATALPLKSLRFLPNDAATSMLLHNQVRRCETCHYVSVE